MSSDAAQKERERDMNVDVHDGAEDLAEDEELDPEFEALKANLAQQEKDVNELQGLAKSLESSKTTPHGPETSADGAAAKPANGEGTEDTAGAAEDKEEVDGRSVFIGNVDYGATPEEIQQYFQACGAINRVTILCDKFTGHPKGYAYVEFADSSSISNALLLNESSFRGRLIQVTPKRTNKPGFNRGRGRGRGGYRGGYAPRGYGYQPYRGRGRGRGRGH